MKTYTSLVCMCLFALALAAPISAQQSTSEAVIEPVSSTFPFSEPCPVPAQDRTINICTPPDGVFLTSPFLLRAKAADAAGLHGIALYINGIFQGSAETLPPDVTIRQFLSPGTYRITLQAKDSAGFFKKTVNISVSTASPCPPNATNRTVRICSPAPNETVSSPVHISGVATDSADAHFSASVATTIYVDGQVASFANGQDGSGKVVNSWILLFPGQHRVTIQHHDQTGATFQKTEFINVN